MSETARERKSARLRRREGDWKERISSAETLPTVKRTQTRRKELVHRRFADLLPESRPVGYGSSLCSGSFAVSVAFIRKSRLPLGLQDSDFKSRSFFLVPLLCCTFTLKDH